MTGPCGPAGRIGDAENVDRIYTEAFLKALRPEALPGIARDFNLVIDYAYANVSSILPDILRRLEVDMVELNANLDDARWTSAIVTCRVHAIFQSRASGTFPSSGHRGSR